MKEDKTGREVPGDRQVSGSRQVLSEQQDPGQLLGQRAGAEVMMDTRNFKILYLHSLLQFEDFYNDTVCVDRNNLTLNYIKLLNSPHCLGGHQLYVLVSVSSSVCVFVLFKFKVNITKLYRLACPPSLIHSLP